VESLVGRRSKERELESEGQSDDSDEKSVVWTVEKWVDYLVDEWVWQSEKKKVEKKESLTGSWKDEQLVSQWESQSVVKLGRT
jgi:hypothetical protein